MNLTSLKAYFKAFRPLSFTLYPLLITLFLLFTLSGLNLINGEVRIPNVLSSNMVIQRNEEIKIWGWADKGETVKVNFNNLNRTTRASKEGTWFVVFPPMIEGGTYEIKIQGKNNTIVLDNILIGDVWVCSGQSNMGWSVLLSGNPEEEIKNANHPQIRLLNIPRNPQLGLAYDVPQTAWAVCTPENIPDFSAVGYHFGREIHYETGVPIGLVSTKFGGTKIEEWTSVDCLEAFPEYASILPLLHNNTPKDIKRASNARIQMLQDEYNIIVGEIPSGSWEDPETDLSHWGPIQVPRTWGFRGISGVNGVMWFRKEIDLSTEQAGSDLILHLGKINESDITWVNGIKVGHTLNQDIQRSYKLNQEILKPGKNVIVVKITKLDGEGGFISAPVQLKISGDNFSIPLAGTWIHRLSGEKFSYTHAPMPPRQIPSQLFNGMIYPLLNLKIKGTIWYQGESDTDQAYLYRKLFPNMIRCWRSYWKQPDMPFLFVQLANFRDPVEEPAESDWAELREAQLMTLSMPHTGMTVAIDIGEAKDIHPKNKQDVGKRLALNALKIAYGKDIVSMGPIYESMEISGNRIILTFNQTGSGLEVKDKYGYLKGFSIAGSDRKFHWAQAWIDEDKVIVKSPSVPTPIAVRYGWAVNPDDVNLYNAEGLPASPFRTDDWPGITER